MIARPLAPTAVPPEGVTLRPQPGNGVRVTYHPSQGVSYSADQSAPPPSLAWRPALVGQTVRFFADGRVMGIQPRIGEAKLLEGAVDLRGLPPVNGESWVCVEVTPTNGFVASGKEGEALNKNLVIVHRDSPFTQTAETGRHPLALIVWAGKVPQMLVQHTWFNLLYARRETGTRINHEFR